MTRSFIHQVIPQLKAAARTRMVLARPWVRRQPAVSAVPPDGPWKDPQLPLNYYWVGLGLFCAGGCLTVYLLPAPPADSTNVLAVTAKVALEAYKGLSNEIGSGPGVKSVKPGTAKAPQTQTKNTKAETVQPNQQAEEPLRKAAGLLLKRKHKGGRKRRRLRFRK